MSTKLYVGNLSYDVTGDDLTQLFQPHGTVETANIVVDRATGRSKGFGFVEMTDSAEAKAAIAALNGQDHSGRKLTVDEARPRSTDSRGGGGGGRW